MHLLKEVYGQDAAKVTHAAKLTKEEAYLDFGQDAPANHNKVTCLLMYEVTKSLGSYAAQSGSTDV